MAHEVVKLVRGRRYRYRVENFRDPATGKVRGRWTYLGREPAEDGRAPGAGGDAPRDPARTRARLIEALGRLLERESYETVTAAAISREAGLAHGTFYRHFSDKRAALMAVFEEFRATIARTRPAFGEPIGDLATERARVAAWVDATFEGVLERPGVLRAYYALGSSDPTLYAGKLARRLELRENLARHFVRLTHEGLTSIAQPEPLAAALLALVDGALHVVVLERRPFDPATIAGARDVFDRAIFTRPEAAAPR